MGDTVRNWNGLGVQLTSVFHLTQDPVQPAGYEYLGVRVTTVNRSKTESYAIGVNKDNTALLDAINQALAELTADGTIQSIVDKYISAE